MSRAARRKKFVRGAFAGVGVCLLTLSFGAQVLAQSGGGSLTNVKPNGQGWFYDRSTSTDPLYNTSLPGQGANAQFGGDHLYIGWDGADQDSDKADAISAINFDAFQLGIPEGATITKFLVRLIEHTQDDPRQGIHDTPTASTAYTQGLIGCPMSLFLAGTSATPISQAPPRECSGTVATGVRNTTQVPIDSAVADSVTNRGFVWTFDLTAIAKNLMSDGDNLSFVFEPKVVASQTQTWMLSFHNGDYAVANKPLPGVSADIAWTAPDEDFESIDDGGFDTGFENFGDFGGADFPSFSSSGGLSETFSEDNTTAPRTRRNAPRQVAGTFAEGKPANFWDIPPLALLGLIIGLLFLLSAGLSMLADVQAARPAGAVSALMTGYSQTSSQPEERSP